MSGKYDERALDLIFQGLDEKFQGVHAKLDERFDSLKETTDAILVQSKTTNGRVNKLEKWRTFIGGGVAVICFTFVPFVIPIVVSTIKLWIVSVVGS